MVMPEVKITPPGVGIQVPGWRNVPPRRSNQTPEGPANPMPLLVSQFQGYPQMIKTELPHTTPNIDNNYQGEHNYQIQQRMKTRIPTNLPPGVNPGSYGFIIEPPLPGGIKTVGNVGRINPPAGYTINPIILGEQPWQPGIRQHTTVPIEQIVPPGVYPDTYGKKQMSYDTTSGFLLGGILGFIAGALIFTATGRKITSDVSTAASKRVSGYIAPRS